MKTSLLSLKTCIAAIMLTATCCLSAQNFCNGYIITTQGEKVYGQIDYRTDNINAKRCIFKASNGDIASYQPFDIQGYQITDKNKYYVSRNVSLKSDQDSVPVFLEYLFQGIKSVYFYENEEETPCYFIENNGRLVKVDAPKIDKRVIYYQYRGEKDRYIPILHYIFQDCPEVQKDIDKASFTHEDMINIAKKYHYAMSKSGDNSVKYEAVQKKENKLNINITPYVGIMHYDIPKKSSIVCTGNVNTGVLFGVALKLSNDRLSRQFSGILDLSLSRLTTDAKTRKEEATLFSPKVGIRYTVPTTSVLPFFEGGGNFTIPVSSPNNWVENGLVGIYLRAGIDIRTMPGKKQAVQVHVQYGSGRDISAKLSGFNGFSAGIGYAF